MVVNVNDTVFWYVTPCSLIEGNVLEELNELPLSFTGREEQLLNCEYLRFWLLACIKLRCVDWPILWSG
jgi:hypothetical protein